MRKLIEAIVTSAALIVSLAALGMTQSPEIQPVDVALFAVAIGRA